MSGTIEYSFDITYAGIPLEVVSLQESIGRQIAQHRASRGDGAQLSDRGQEPRVYVLQVQLTGDAAQIREKRNALVSLRNSGDTRALQHPLDGIIRCKLEAFSPSYSAGTITADMTLIEDVPFTERFERLALTTAGTLQAIQISAQALDLLQPSIDQLSPTVATAIGQAVAVSDGADSWANEVRTEVIAQVEEFRAYATAAQSELDAATGVAEYEVSIALQELRGAVERYAQATQALDTGVFELRVKSAGALIVLLSQLYGASRAEELVDEVVRTNDVRDATYLQPGTVLVLPRRAAA